MLSGILFRGTDLNKLERVQRTFSTITYNTLCQNHNSCSYNYVSDSLNLQEY
jgi:hypothetical protein